MQCSVVDVNRTMSKLSLLFRAAPKSDAKARVFCFPFAGGSVSTYMPWLKLLHPDAELIAIQLPGRGNRLLDIPYDDIDSLVADLFAEIKPYLDRPYLFFGHSMGAKIAFDLAVQFHRNKLPLPANFIASGSAAPFKPRKSAAVHALSDADFIRRLSELNGTPDKVLNNKELMGYLLPALRADFKMTETYLREIDCVLPTAVVIYGGEQDEAIPKEDLMAWVEVFEQTEATEIFPGGHFFLNEHTEDIVARINGMISRHVFSE